MTSLKDAYANNNEMFTDGGNIQNMNYDDQDDMNGSGNVGNNYSSDNKESRQSAQFTMSNKEKESFDNREKFDNREEKQPPMIVPNGYNVNYQNSYANNYDNQQYRTAPPAPPKKVQRNPEYSFWDRMVMSKNDVLKLVALSLIIVLGISLEKVLFHYINQYLTENFYPDYNWESSDFYREQVDKYGDHQFYINDKLSFDYTKYENDYKKLDIYPWLYDELEEMFDDYDWKDIFKKWFETNTGLKVDWVE
jgi:hypothetical protein